MDKNKKEEILVFHNKLDMLATDTADVKYQLDTMRQNDTGLRNELNDLLTEARKLAEDMGQTVDLPQPLPIETVSLNADIDAAYSAFNAEFMKTKIFPKLRTEEMIFSAIECDSREGLK